MIYINPATKELGYRCWLDVLDCKLRAINETKVINSLVIITNSMMCCSDSGDATVGNPLIFSAPVINNNIIKNRWFWIFLPLNCMGHWRDNWLQETITFAINLQSSFRFILLLYMLYFALVCFYQYPDQGS